MSLVVMYLPLLLLSFILCFTTARAYVEDERIRPFKVGSRGPTTVPTFAPSDFPSDSPSSLPSLPPQIVGVDICACQPAAYEFTLNFDLTCDNVTLGGLPSILDSACIVNTDLGVNVTDVTPQTVTNILILEMDQELKTLASTTISANFSNGDKFQYTSVIAAETAATLPANDIPKVFQVNLEGQNAVGQEIVAFWIIVYTNECDTFPVLQEGQQTVWTEVSKLTNPPTSLCPLAAASPVPTLSPILASEEPSSIPTIPPPTSPTPSPGADQIWEQVGNTINGQKPEDFAGTSISLSGDGTTLAVGATGHSNRTGQVTVFRFDGDKEWKQLGEPLNGESVYDDFGYSISLSEDGNVLAVGARGNNPNPDAVNAGSVKVFRYQDGLWEQVGSGIDGEDASDESGFSVALSSNGTTVAVGAIGNDGGGSLSGHARVFRLVDDEWVQLGQDLDGEAENDLSGYSVAISADGSIVAVASKNNDDGGSNAGQVRVFQYDDDAATWVQLGEDINGETKFDESGFAISLNANGTIVAIGSPYNNDNGLRAGQVRVYEFNDGGDGGGGSWEQLGEDIEGEAFGDRSGYSVSLNAFGDVVAIGAEGSDDGGALSGQVRVYQFSDGSWTKLGQDLAGEKEYDYFGHAVSLSSSGIRLAASANYADNKGASSGSAQVFDLVDNV